jgi:hypothetical protein
VRPSRLLCDRSIEVSLNNERRHSSLSEAVGRVEVIHNKRMRQLCLSCGTLVIPDGAASTPCHACGSEQVAVQWHRMRRFAEYVVRFGFQYPEQYRKDYEAERDSRVRYFLLPPHEILVFVALAVLSGIVGNASYDLVKAVVRRIKATFDSETHADLPVIDDAFVEQLDQCFRDFLSGMRDLTPEARLAVIEEIIVDRMTDFLMTHPEEQLRLAAAETPEQSVEIWLDLFRRAQQEQPELLKAEPADFHDLWTNIDL